MVKVSGVDFTRLNVWNEAKTLAVDVYKSTNKEPVSKDFGFKE
ncbi:hypothetical protein SAMN02745176_00565 [Lutispora thermophila DSM 19022]|uniref:Uncharacterized protein n=1 Tax=Lutispora thermophila DSM 19022 TaxID=1122184 RepID=A0A1M6BVV3_9FIRM|nr:hypothetical protein SAMN02745176_00565 [Lutispora thermophila DSM 19022]